MLIFQKRELHAWFSISNCFDIQIDTSKYIIHLTDKAQFDTVLVVPG